MRHLGQSLTDICETVADGLRRAFRTVVRLPGLRHLYYAYKTVARWTHHRLPRGLFARSLLIIIIPMLLLQAVVATVFMERHWQMVTHRLADAVTGDIAAIIDLIETTDTDYQDEIISIAARDMGLRVAIEPGGKLPPPLPKPFFGLLDQVLAELISAKIGRPFWIDTLGDSRFVEIRIKLDDGILRIFARRSMTYASNTHIFILWMVGTSLVLIGIATLFLRGQIRPILRLTQAAEDFGKGNRSSRPFTPRGAIEIRRAGLAFILMRERIERQIEQRTTMLNGVSHDLRTILTRFKLQLALIGDSPEVEALNQDIEEMQKMLEGYIDFARGDAEEITGTASLSALFRRQQEDFELSGKSLHYVIVGDDAVTVRPNAFARLVANLASNAKRHANRLEITAEHGDKWLTISFDDDGPGIAPDMREEVFKPFLRLDNARNLDSSGTGLGLAIARDIARGHGGNVVLSESPLGGLRATIHIPC
ncbi:two-component system osmolarity sensor histidine kinase EnvZ [Martelella radicis]|uniref:histidine kinase n=1 Tax=Martelella radicis TaxID=1397476 RepID=A0A7W6P967_9HYPH|nr:two-component system osmolarity sensor histidine kinase EnvZ [Martelella radicis]